MSRKADRPSAPLIERIEPLRPRGLRVRIHLDPGEPLEVTLEAIARSRLGVGDILTADRKRHLLDADADIRVRDAALSLLSHRARSRAELRRRLLAKGFQPPRVDTCLDLLQRRGLVDDAAVAAAFVRDRLRHRPRGRARLCSELRAKGVARDTAERVVDRVLDDEEVTDATLARRVADAWLARQGPKVVQALGADPRNPEREKARRRLYGYLARRGFGGDALRDAMDSVSRRRS